jgi:single-strand DNA-binding protein
MAKGVNKVIIVGNLTRDPELEETRTGTPVCKFGVATNESWKDKEGEWQERVEYHNITVFGKRGENCKKYLSKGRQVYVEGKLKTSSWTHKKYDDVKMYRTEVEAFDVQFLGGKGDNNGGSSSRSDDEF